VSLNKYLISLVLIFFILPSSYADQVVVTDGDTIRIDGERIRFSGIDAPELKQTCLYQDIEFQCGEFSKNLLIEKIANQNVNCVRESTDQYGRTLAECFIGQESLSRFLVRAGYAFAYRKYSKKFIKDEEYAMKKGIGMWSTDCLFPWDFRKVR
jgi:endonuclease YncB( thermonuclease family)